MRTIEFWFHTGLRQRLFENVRLQGSWDESGRWNDHWSTTRMKELCLDDGTFSYQASIDLEAPADGRPFEWGVLLDGPAGKDLWGVAAEVKDWKDTRRVRQLSFDASTGVESYYLTHCARLGANWLRAQGRPPEIRFAVWAPNAKSAEVVFGAPANGYIDDDGGGIVGRPVPMKPAGGGVWEATFRPNDPTADIVYMYRLTRDDGKIVYKTDLYSRCQAGSGDFDPKGKPYAGTALALDGAVSCAYVMDPAKVESPAGTNRMVPEAEFWADELDPNRPLPRRIEDLVIYELHVGGLAYGKPRPGNLADARALIPYLRQLGVNAVELLPMTEYTGTANWGYGTTHFCAVEFSSGGPDDLKAFVKECHQNGIAVIMDVVYNHYPPEAGRAEWMYDTVSHERNSYYWYEGREADYGTFPEGGYVDNISSGWDPRFHEEMVRQLFTSSAASMMLDFHVDGFRVDQTTSIHSYPALHKDGSPVDAAKSFGQKFLREWVRTVRLLRPGTFLIAEDHSGWDEVTRPSDQGGIGFDVAWYADFYHHLTGDTGKHPELLASAGYGQDGALDMAFFGGILERTAGSTLVFSESHDESGNSRHEGMPSARTIMVAAHASDPAMLTGLTRHYAEARTRFAAGMALLSAGVPMIFMGEEVGATEPYKYDTWFNNRVDLTGLQANSGGGLFKFHADLIRFRRTHPGLTSRNIRVLHARNDNRVIAFQRGDGPSALLVLASLNNHPFSSGYVVQNAQLPEGPWTEIFNSDSHSYGGDDVGNAGATLQAWGGRFEAKIPANGFVVFAR